MITSNVVESFLRAAQEKRDNQEYGGQDRGSSDGDGGLTVDINKASMNVTNIPWFLSLAA